MASKKARQLVNKTWAAHRKAAPSSVGSSRRRGAKPPDEPVEGGFAPSNILPGLDKVLRAGLATVRDPGDGGIIDIELKSWAICEVRTVGAESRIMPPANRYAVGHELMIVLREGGPLTISGVGSDPNVLEAAGDIGVFRVSQSGDTPEFRQWRTVSTSPVTPEPNFATATRRVKPTGETTIFATEEDNDIERASKFLTAQSVSVEGDVVIHDRGNLDFGSLQFGKDGVHLQIAPRVRMITTAATGLWNGDGSFEWPYTYNLEKGLRRWFNSLGQVHKTVADAFGARKGGGGVDVVCLGKSLTEFGTGSAYPLESVGVGGVSFEQWRVDKWSHHLMVLLQDHYNPPDVQGGAGYIMCIVGSQSLTPSRNIWAKTGSWTETLSNFNSHCGRNMLAGPGENSVVFRLNGTDFTDAAYRRANVTGWEISGRRVGSNGVIRWDVGDGAPPAIGAGTTTGTIDTSGIDTSSVHWPETGTPLAVNDPQADNHFQVAAPESSGNIQFDGAIFYCDDYDCGVRLHNIGFWGKAATGVTANELAGALRFFSASAGDTPPFLGARHGKLAIIDYIGNDVDSNDPDAFHAAYENIVSQILSQPSKPSVLIQIPPHPFNNSTYRARYHAYTERLYQIADEYGDVAIINFESKMLHANNTNGWRALGGNEADFTHYSLVGHRLVAEELFALLKR